MEELTKCSSWLKDYFKFYNEVNAPDGYYCELCNMSLVFFKFEFPNPYDEAKINRQLVSKSVYDEFKYEQRGLIGLVCCSRCNRFKFNVTTGNPLKQSLRVQMAIIEHMWEELTELP